MELNFLSILTIMYPEKISLSFPVSNEGMYVRKLDVLKNFQEVSTVNEFLQFPSDIIILSLFEYTYEFHLRNLLYVVQIQRFSYL